MFPGRLFPCLIFFLIILTGGGLPCLWAAETQSPKAEEVIQPQGAIKFFLPADHDIFSFVIEDKDGKRVCNLHSMTEPKEFQTGITSPEGNIELLVSWDGRDDLGNVMPPGIYRARGLSLPRTKVFYEYGWYNPGNPPWYGYAKSSWLGDHSGPSSISMTLNPDVLWAGVISSPIAEGGDTIIILDQNGRKFFSFKRGWDGSNAVDFFEDEIWILMTGKRADLMKMAVGTGNFKGFQRKAGITPQVKMPGDAVSLAVSKKFAAVSLKNTEKPGEFGVWLIDKNTGDVIAHFPLPAAPQLARNPVNDEIYASLPDKGIFIIDKNGPKNPIPLPGLTSPGAICFDREGNLCVMDTGPDYQVKVYSPQNRLLRSYGAKGGQQGLEFNPLALHNVKDISADAHDRLWVVETENPRRVLAFSKDGKIEREYLGNASYAAGYIAHHEQDPARAIVSELIFKIDPTKPAYAGYPLRYASSPLKEKSP